MLISNLVSEIYCDNAPVRHPPPPLLGKVVVPHYWIVLLVSLIAPKRIEPITWDWSHIEDILEGNMVNFQNEGKRVPRGPHGAPKD